MNPVDNNQLLNQFQNSSDKDNTAMENAAIKAGLLVAEARQQQLRQKARLALPAPAGLPAPAKEESPIQVRTPQTSDATVPTWKSPYFYTKKGKRDENDKFITMYTFPDSLHSWPLATCDQPQYFPTPNSQTRTTWVQPEPFQDTEDPVQKRLEEMNQAYFKNLPSEDEPTPKEETFGSTVPGAPKKKADSSDSDSTDSPSSSRNQKIGQNLGKILREGLKNGCEFASEDTPNAQKSMDAELQKLFATATKDEFLLPTPKHFELEPRIILSPREINAPDSPDSCVSTPGRINPKLKELDALIEAGMPINLWSLVPIACPEQHVPNLPSSEEGPKECAYRVGDLSSENENA